MHILSIANPGPYPASVLTPGFFLLALLTGGLIVLEMAAVGRFLTALSRVAGKARKTTTVPRRVLLFRLVAAATGALVAASLAFVGAYATADISMSSERDAYPTAVSDWLAEDYGIVADTDSTELLVNGESLVVKYDGRDILIELAHRANSGDLAVRVPDGQLLTPLN